jgi:thiol-disulfide isomerase/thioredoxin
MKTPSALALLLLLACDAKGASSPAPQGRVVAVAAAKVEQGSAEFCDVAPPAASAPTFKLPPVEGDASFATRGPRWINVWATWCPPCIEELPLLRLLQARFATSGAPVSLVLISVDAAADEVSKFEQDHPEVGGTLRVTDPAALEPWLTSLGLDRGATLPVHVFVDANDRVTCARTGAIRATDEPRIRQLLSAR